MDIDEDKELMEEIKRWFKESNERAARLARGELKPEELKEIKAAQREGEKWIKKLRKRIRELAKAPSKA